MLYREIIAVCSQIHTNHINTVCGQNVTPVIHTISTAIQTISIPVHNMTYAIHDISYSCNAPASSIVRIFSRRLYGRKLIGCQSVWGAPQGHHDIPQTREESDRTRESCRRAWTANKPSGRVRMLFVTPNWAVLQTQLYSGGHQYWTRIPTVHQDKEDAVADRPYLKSLPTLILSFQNRYALGGPGIESRRGWDFLHPFRPAVEPTQLPVQWGQSLFPEGKEAEAWR